MINHEFQNAGELFGFWTDFRMISSCWKKFHQHRLCFAEIGHGFFYIIERNDESQRIARSRCICRQFQNFEKAWQFENDLCIVRAREPSSHSKLVGARLRVHRSRFCRWKLWNYSVVKSIKISTEQERIILQNFSKSTRCYKSCILFVAPNSTSTDWKFALFCEMSLHFANFETFILVDFAEVGYFSPRFSQNFSKSR